MLPPNGNENLCGHNFSPEICPYEGCGFRAALKKIADLEAQLKFADPCGIAKDVLNGTYRFPEPSYHFPKPRPQKEE